MSNEPQTPTVTVTDQSEDVTEKERSPAENAFYESFLIQSRSAIENLYASNIYHSQKHAKQVKDLERQKHYCMSQMNNNQKELVKRMVQLQEKQEQIMEEKRKQCLKVLSTKGQRISPHSTSSLADRDSRLLKHRPRSGSMPFLEPINQSLVNQNFSKSSENIHSHLFLLNTSFPTSILSQSREDLPDLAKKRGKVILPALQPKTPPAMSLEDSPDDSDSTFITRVSASPPTNYKPKLNVTPRSLKLNQRRGSLDPTVIRELDNRRGIKADSPPSSPKSTYTKWVPKSYTLP